MKKNTLAILLGSILPGWSSAVAVDLYVSPQGNDAWSGRVAARSRDDGPLATLDGARQVIRRMKQAGGLVDQPVTVHVAPGEYCRDVPFTLAAEDSGTAAQPITYVAEGGEVRIVGGRRLSSEMFTRVDDTTAEVLPADVRGRVLSVDLKRLGIRDYGTYPEAFRDPPAVPELFFNDQRMTLARWPNQDWATIAKVIKSGPAEWRNCKSDDLGTFEYSGDRPANWLKGPGVWLTGYWCFDWAEETIRIKEIDAANRRITLGSRHVYGLGSGNPAPRRYYAVNVLAELDSPSEYYIDREQGRLYFLPPGLIEGARVVLSTLGRPVIDVRDAAYITLRGLIVEACVGSAIEVKDGRDVRIEACRVRNTGQAGIRITGGLHHTISDCEIHDTGTLAVFAEGGDRKTLTPCGHEVVNNHIYRPGRRKLTYAGHVHLGGVGVRVAHNLIHDGPHLAIILNGNDHVIEYNDIHHVANDTDDCGAFYMGRNASERGTLIRYNFWHDVGSRFAHGSCAIYFDDGAGGQTVLGNVFLRAAGGSFGAVFSHGGHDNMADNNIFVECTRALGSAPWDDKRWKDYVDAPLWQRLLLKEVDITRAPYLERYPDLAGFMQPGGRPRRNHASRNVAVRCKDFANGNWDPKDNFVTEAGPGFVDPAGLDFSLSDNSVVFEKIPGFERIPFSQIGIRRPSHR